MGFHAVAVGVRLTKDHTDPWDTFRLITKRVTVYLDEGKEVVLETKDLATSEKLYEMSEHYRRRMKLEYFDDIVTRKCIRHNPKKKNSKVVKEEYVGLEDEYFEPYEQKLKTEEEKCEADEEEDDESEEEDEISHQELPQAFHGDEEIDEQEYFNEWMMDSYAGQLMFKENVNFEIGEAHCCTNMVYLGCVGDDCRGELETLSFKFNEIQEFMKLIHRLIDEGRMLIHNKFYDPEDYDPEDPDSKNEPLLEMVPNCCS
jgi:hypothetical protein